jgi:hypothetical protein
VGLDIFLINLVFFFFWFDCVRSKGVNLENLGAFGRLICIGFISNWNFSTCK